MKIQEVMTKQLCCLTWGQVTEEYPITSSYKALSEYFIAFKDWVSITYRNICHSILLLVWRIMMSYFFCCFP